MIRCGENRRAIWSLKLLICSVETMVPHASLGSVPELAESMIDDTRLRRRDKRISVAGMAPVLLVCQHVRMSARL